MNEISIIPITGLPEIKKGDQLASMTLGAIDNSGIEIKENDVFVVTQKLFLKVKVWREI